MSWTADGRTFTVWNPDQMEKEQLPNTFKHSNFASFVRQLNNYGFRKCHSDRFEFGVEGFEQGRPELLTALKRHDAPRNKKGGAGVSGKNASSKKNERASGLGPRGGRDATDPRLLNGGGSRGGHGEYRTDASAAHPRGGTPADGAQSLELGAYGGVTSEVEQLKRDRLLLLKEVMRLREEQSATADEGARLGARLQSTEQFQTTMLNFVDQVRESGGKLENLSFDGFAALDIPGLSTGTVPGAGSRASGARCTCLPPRIRRRRARDLARAGGGDVASSGSRVRVRPKDFPGRGASGLAHQCSARRPLRWRSRFQEIEEDMPAADDALAQAQPEANPARRSSAPTTKEGSTRSRRTNTRTMAGPGRSRTARLRHSTR